MTLQKESVVTPERFEKGISWADWMARIDRNQDKFAENYEGFNPDPADIAAIKDLVQRGASRCLALGEAWCPDVFRGLPVIAKVAEQTGMDLKIFFRDENLDIMNEFLKDGEFQSIPTAVFYTRDGRYLYHFSERPKQANEEMPIMRKLYEGRTREEAAPDVLEFQKTSPVWAGWRDATITEIRENLEKATS
jgi:hypothetical protein